MMFRKALWPSDGCTDAILHAEPTDCGMRAFDTDTIDESVIAAWNRRTAQAELVSALAGIIDHFGCERGPGHSHDVPGIWDSDNHPYLAGTRCEWCAHWEAARATLSKYRTDGGV